MENGREYTFTSEAADSGTVLTLDGTVDERADLVGAFSGLPDGPLVINLKGVSRINSSGVRNWINAIKSLAGMMQIEFVECSRAIVDQLNMINNFAASGRVVSFYAPYYCEECEKESEKLIVVEEHFPNREDREEPEAPEYDCPGCGARDMDFIEDEDKFFYFLSR